MRQLYAVVRAIVPEERLFIRALVCVTLALIAFSLPLAISWWAGVFFSYMAFNVLLGNAIANFGDVVHRVITQQPIDRKFAEWLNRLELLSDVPDDAYTLYSRGLSPREARDVISGRGSA